MHRIAILGLGIIGKIWADNLYADGLDVVGWNRTAQAVAFFEPDLVTAVTKADFIIIVVADPPAVESVLAVILPHLRPGQMIIQSSTISARWTLHFSQKVESTGASFLEAPFTGSKLAAEARKTVFYLGGAPENIQKAQPVLQRLATKLIRIGETGTASSLKLALNLNIAVVAGGLNEALTLARSQGISDDLFFEALGLNVARSGLSDLKEPKLRTRDYSPQFSLKHLDKDLRLALETAGELDLPLTQTLKLGYQRGIDSGFGNDDFIGLIRLSDSVPVVERLT